MSPPDRTPDADRVVAAALAEDLGVAAEQILGAASDRRLLDRDVTTASVVPADARFTGRIVSRAAGVACGIPFARRAWELLADASGSEAVVLEPVVAEGDPVASEEALATIDGPARLVLAGERVALNLLMTLSGIATAAAVWQHAAGASLEVVDTRKSYPGLLALSKYAVRTGGAHNHRAGLWDMVLVKDNHLRHAGGVRAAVEAASAAHPGLRVEVEADTVEQAREAAIAGADMVLLDNMDDTLVAQAVAAVRAESEGCLVEASGSITFERLPALREAGVDRVSTSAVTMAPPLDIALDELG